MVRASATLGLTALLLLGIGCIDPLSDPPALADVARKAQANADLKSLIDEAQAAWSARPDEQKVVQALDLYLQAAVSAGNDTGAAQNALIGAARAAAWIAEHEKEDADRREATAVRVIESAQLCQQVANEPDSATVAQASAAKDTKVSRYESANPACDYWLAIGLGLQAREKPGKSLSGLSLMIKALESLTERAPKMDHGGPHRVLALVLLRAPGWPVGPRDPDAALEHAQAAVTIDDAFPPNLLALAEAYEETGEPQLAREAYTRARLTAQVLAAEGNPDAPEWSEQAQKKLEG